MCIHRWLTLYADRKGTKVQCVRCSEVRRWTFMPKSNLITTMADKTRSN